MSLWLTLVIAALVVEAVVVVVIVAVDGARRARERAAATAELAANTGLDLRDVSAPARATEPMGVALHGLVDGVDVRIRNGARLHPPGVTTEDAAPAVCSVTMAADLDDAIFCKVDQADAIVGPLPTARRVRTGHALFDHRYAIFLSPSAERREGGFRSAPVERSFATLPTDVFDTLIDLGAEWGRCQEGHVQIVTAQLSSVDLPRACSLAARVAGRPGPAIPRGARAKPPPDSASEMLLLFGIGIAFFGTSLGVIPGFLLEAVTSFDGTQCTMAGVGGTDAVCVAVLIFFAGRRLLRGR
jgi:hypothetical protein